MNDVAKFLWSALMFVCLVTPPWNLFWWVIGYFGLWLSTWERPRFDDVVLLPFQVVIVGPLWIVGLFCK